MTTAATKVRLRFAKCGDLRLVSHHDLMRCLERMLRRAAIPVAQSQGFNPRPKVVFALALALGVEGRREVVELELTEPLSPDEVLRRLRAVAPPGLDFFEAEAVAPGRAAHAEAVAFTFDVPDDRRDDARARLDRFLASTTWPYTRHRPDRDRDVAVDLRPFVLDAELGPAGALRFRLKITPDGSARPEEVVEALGIRDLLGRGSVLVRTDMELAGP
jgi:radical SAM-linked protein